VPVAALAAIAVIVLDGGGGDDGGGQTTSSIATTTNQQGSAAVPTKSVRLPGRPNNIVVASGNAWVVRSGNDRLAAIDVDTLKRKPFSPRVGNPAGEAAGFGKLWVANQDGPTLIPIGLKSHRQEGREAVLPAEGRPVAVAVGDRAVWVGLRGSPGHLLRVDPRAREVVKDIPLPDGLQNIAVGGGAVWVIARRANTVTRVDIASATQRPIFVGERPFGIAYGQGAVWVTNNGDDTVTRIDAGSLNTSVIPTGRGPKGIAVGAGGVWVANSIASTLTRIDTETSEPAGQPIKVATNPYAVDVAGDDVWVTSPPAGQVQRLSP
jgi:YVTN family beta-propeller protein